MKYAMAAYYAILASLALGAAAFYYFTPEYYSAITILALSWALNKFTDFAVWLTGHEVSDITEYTYPIRFCVRGSQLVVRFTIKGGHHLSSAVDSFTRFLFSSLFLAICCIVYFIPFSEIFIVYIALKVICNLYLTLTHIIQVNFDYMVTVHWIIDGVEQIHPTTSPPQLDLLAHLDPPPRYSEPVTSRVTRDIFFDRVNPGVRPSATISPQRVEVAEPEPLEVDLDASIMRILNTAREVSTRQINESDLNPTQREGALHLQEQIFAGLRRRMNSAGHEGPLISDDEESSDEIIESVPPDAPIPRPRWMDNLPADSPLHQLRDPMTDEQHEANNLAFQYLAGIAAQSRVQQAVSTLRTPPDGQSLTPPPTSSMPRPVTIPTLDPQTGMWTHSVVTPGRRAALFAQLDIDPNSPFADHRYQLAYNRSTQASTGTVETFTPVHVHVVNGDYVRNCCIPVPCFNPLDEDGNSKTKCFRYVGSTLPTICFRNGDPVFEINGNRSTSWQFHHATSPREDTLHLANILVGHKVCKIKIIIGRNRTDFTLCRLDRNFFVSPPLYAVTVHDNLPSNLEEYLASIPEVD